MPVLLHTHAKISSFKSYVANGCILPIPYTHDALLQYPAALQTAQALPGSVGMRNMTKPSAVGWYWQVKTAVKDGYDLRGYHYWTLLDNFGEFHPAALTCVLCCKAKANRTILHMLCCLACRQEMMLSAFKQCNHEQHVACISAYCCGNDYWLWHVEEGKHLRSGQSGKQVLYLHMMSVTTHSLVLIEHAFST